MKLYQEIAKNFSKMKKFFTEEGLEEFSRALPGHLEKYNTGIGTLIRLKLLRPENALYKNFARNGFSGRNKMSLEMLKEFHRHINFDC